MIIKLKTKYWTKRKNLEDCIPFFREFGSIKKDEPEEDGNFDAEYIGHIDIVPIQVLNHDYIECEFFKNHESGGENSTLLTLVDKISKLDLGVAKKQSEGAISIHLPSPELSFFNKVDFEEDCCTDRLQGKIDEGWRIIACIPRPGQRRPDYVIGKKE